jgi:hypothetical protein
VSARITRRAVLAGALGAALTPAVALAGPVEEGSLLVGLWQREAAAELAYRAHRGEFAGVETMQAHSGMHVSALSTELGALGVPFPAKPAGPAQFDPLARALAAASGDAVLPAAMAMEHSLVAAYQAGLPVPTDLKVATTLATILASHAQHELMLRAEHGLEPLPVAQAAG